MELKYLYTVKKITEVGNYQRAAVALNYAQSTITFQVKQLEKELNIQLFEKSGGNMILTKAGEAMMPMIDQVITSVNTLMSHQNSQEGLCGTLVIALPESLITYQLQGVLKEFKEKAPQVKLSLRVMNCYAIFDQLCGNDIDIAIHYDVGNYPTSVVTEKLRAYPLVLVCSPEIPENERDFITPNQEKKLCHIQNDQNALSLKIFQQYLRQKAIFLEPELEVWSIEAIKKSVISNLGVAFLPRFTVEDELSSGILQEIPTSIIEPKMTAVYAYSRNKWQSPAMQEFLAILKKHFSTSTQ